MSRWHEYDLPELDELRGPSEGTVQLPINLYWTNTQKVFDLSDKGDIWTMYGNIFAEGTREEISRYINKGILLSILGSVPLPTKVEEFYGVLQNV